MTILFRRLSGLAGAVFMMGMLGLLAPNASATTTFISNLPVNDGLALAMFNTQAYGAGFTMIDDYDFDAAILSLRTSTVAPTTSQVSLSIYSDSGSNEPGTLLEALSGPASFAANTTADYTFTPTSPITLHAGQTYWLVLYYTGGLTLYWQASNPPVDATGTGATYARTMFANPFGSGWTQQKLNGQDVGPGLTLQGTASAPEPGTLAAMALGLAGLLAVRRFRRVRA